ncbi:glycosyl transferase [Sphingomonas oleivorans]|uniref:Glycosyl transferase n=2 Tax=Sphingomonas oleivorans TaxID=1735121 RepID=A0A2T5FXU9_9SPHN|nr:glycosyl transferase [Sphingomonas oleivorans]
MAYARGLMAVIPDRLRFAAVHPGGVYGRLPRSAVLRFLDRTEARWENDGHISQSALRRFAAETLLSLRPRPVSGRSSDATVYVQSSPHHLTRPKLVGRILQRERARFICLVHDLIPLEYPEYARPDGAAQHRKRVDTIVRHADGIIANSNATLRALEAYLTEAGRTPHVRVAHLGTYDAPKPVPPLSDRPYFVCIGTIEPRKNHLLLLNIWRRLSEIHGPRSIPKLILIGRRGWENEQIVDMLDRCPALNSCVEEYSGLPDRQVRTLLAGARALLLPSFAEGYGMPVTEALDMGVPVICSDLPALREAGGDAPDYVDPLDGPEWIRLLQSYALEASPERAAQIDRLSAWVRPTWQKHIQYVREMIEDIVA